MAETDWLEIGTIVAPQGLKGQVRIYPDSDFPERFLQPGRRWLSKPGESDPQPVELISGYQLAGKNLYVVELAGITDRTQAETLRGSKLFVQAGDRPHLEAGEFYVLDLIGLEVYDQATQVLVGVVTNVFSAGNDLLEVERPLTSASTDLSGSENSKPVKPSRVLIPFVEPIVPIVDLEQRRIEITPPRGLID